MGEKPLYVVIQYRYGWTNNGSGIYLVTTDEDRAVEVAEAERDFRGDKFGVEVQKWPDGNDIADPEPVAYFPSAYGEKAPHVNPRIVAMERVGSAVLRALDDGADLPTWVRECAARELEIAERLYGDAARKAAKATD